MVLAAAPRRRTRLLLAAAAAVVAFAAAPSPAARTVTIKGLKFRPDTLTVAVGDTVQWLNGDDEAHTVTMDSTDLDSGDIAPGARFRRAFAARGRYTYHCEVHYRMHAVLVVK